MNSVTPLCRHCRSSDVRDLGVLPDSAEFAGRSLGQALPGGHLRRCVSCAFVFRDPVLEAAQYDALYAQGSAAVWANPTHRADFALVRAEVGNRASRVLDVGCYTGDLLSSLSDDISRFGVEPNPAAAQLAAQRNINILGNDVDQALASGERFDAITLCDVIEHIVEPAPFLEKLARMLNPGGRLLITTGNPECTLWRISRARFWYCYFPEHISFVGATWLRPVAQRIGLQLTKTLSFNYQDLQPGSVAALSRLAGALAYSLFPRTLSQALVAYRRAHGNGAVGAVPPGCGATRDHVLHVLQVAA